MVAYATRWRRRGGEVLLEVREAELAEVRQELSPGVGLGADLLVAHRRHPAWHGHFT